jgi:CRP/FNR family transcriptional regulator, cyclic AMP receptor protein
MNSAALKDIVVLQSMDAAALAKIASVLEEEEYANGQVVFIEGEPGDSMYFISQGCIRIEKRPHPAGEDRKTLAVLEAGDYFGEMALVNQKPRAASAVAAGGARLLRLSKAAFDRIHETSSATALNVLFGMIRTASERIRWLNTQLVTYDEIGKAIGDAVDLHALLDSVLEHVTNATGADWSLLALRSEFTGRLDVRAQRNLTLAAAQLEAISNGGGVLGLVLRNEQDLLAPDLDANEMLEAGPRLGFETASLLVSRIVLAEQVVGLIVLGGNEKHQFDLNTLNLARGIARQAAQAILNQRRREEEEARSHRPRPTAHS